MSEALTALANQIIAWFWEYRGYPPYQAEIDNLIRSAPPGDVEWIRRTIADTRGVDIEAEKRKRGIIPPAPAPRPPKEEEIEPYPEPVGISKFYWGGGKPAFIPTSDWITVQVKCQRMDVNPYIVAAIGKHETNWGRAGAGRVGYHLGVGVPTVGAKKTQYQGLAAQLDWAIPRIRWYFRDRVNLEAFMHFGTWVWRPDNPHSWGRGCSNIFFTELVPIMGRREVPPGAILPPQPPLVSMPDWYFEKYAKPLEEPPKVEIVELPPEYTALPAPEMRGTFSEILRGIVNCLRDMIQDIANFARGG